MFIQLLPAVVPGTVHVPELQVSSSIFFPSITTKQHKPIIYSEIKMHGIEVKSVIAVPQSDNHSAELTYDISFGPFHSNPHIKATISLKDPPYEGMFSSIYLFAEGSGNFVLEVTKIIKGKFDLGMKYVLLDQAKHLLENAFTMKILGHDDRIVGVKGLNMVEERFLAPIAVRQGGAVVTMTVDSFFGEGIARREEYEEFTSHILNPHNIPGIPRLMLFLADAMVVSHKEGSHKAQVGHKAHGFFAKVKDIRTHDGVDQERMHLLFTLDPSVKARHALSALTSLGDETA